MRIEPLTPTRPRTGGRPNRGPRSPNVATVNQVLFLLMQNTGEWFTIVEPTQSGDWGALGIALHRRGCEVHKLLGRVRVRWTHDVPTVGSMMRVVRPMKARVA